MFSWFKKKNKTIDNIYSPKERCIYEYFDGQKQVKADPLVLYKRLQDCSTDLSVDMRLANSIHSDANKGHTNAIKKIQTIFSIKPFDEGGLSEMEAMSLLEHFLFFCDELKKKVSPSATSSTTSEASRTSSPTGRPTSTTSGFGSTANAAIFDKLGSSPTEPQSQLVS